MEYTVFRSLWREHQLSMIHFACVDEAGRSQFMRALYDIALEYLSEDHTITVQVAAVFCLYLLYSTQPSVFKKIPIGLTMSMSQNIDLIYKLAFEYSATDLIFIIHTMREIPVEPLLFDLSRLACDYHQAKSDLVSLGLSRKSSVMVMRELKKQIRPGMNLLKASPIPEFLKDNGSTAANSNSAAGECSRAGGGNPEGDAVSDLMDIDSTEPATTSCRENSRVDADVNADAESISEPNEEDVLQESIIEPRENYPIPRIFNLSMLQASVSDFPVRIEDMLRQFGKDRMRRFEFAAAGELSNHMYKFPQQESILDKRRRVHDGLDKVQRRSLKRKLRTVLKKFSEKQKKALADKGKGKAVSERAVGENGAQVTEEPTQGRSSGDETIAGVAVTQDLTLTDIDPGKNIQSPPNHPDE
ncbi:hypothetical protein BGZ72_001367 [Mortierella alpina]|nr:hypothetical protein BGZ72_001367 [Mortierella alpina]